MKGGNKSQFSAKFGSILTKFKDNSTVQVGHEQIRSILGQFALKDIFTAFVSKMDTIEQMNERQKRQISKIYVTFIEVYKTQLLYDQYYEKFMESLNRKTVGVSEAIGHICKTLLNRIQDQEQLYPFVSMIVNIFRNHAEIGKILKQVAETISPNIISSLQYDIIAILQEKMASAKMKSDHLDAVLSLVLSLQEKLQVESNVQSLLLKYLRHEDWSCRKNCVDISYALLVINQTINESIHSIVKELKYDKIKHVRDSVNNYQKLHQQIFGKEVVQKVAVPTNIRQAKIKSEIFTKKSSKSPVVVTPKQVQYEKEKSSSLDKSIKQKQKNENFFKNAKNSDVIKISEGNTSIIEQRKDEEQFVQPNLGKSVHLPSPKEEFTQQSKGKNFEAYLKDRRSPRQKQVVPFQKIPAATKESEVKKALSKLETIKNEKKNGNKFNYQNEFQHFKKKSRFEFQSVKNQDSKENISFAQADYVEKNQPQFSLSYISNKNEFSLLDEFKGLLFAFQKRINERLDRMEARIESLEAAHDKNSPSRAEQSKTFEVMAQSKMQESPKSMVFNQGPSQSKYSYTQRQGVESNLQEKIRASIVQENWDEAYTIALTNNKKNILLNLLERCVFPRDKIVQQCILLQARKLLGYMSTLKWLKYYLLEKEMSNERLQKLRQDLAKRGTSDNRNYELMRQMLINEIEDKMNA